MASEPEFAGTDSAQEATERLAAMGNPPRNQGKGTK
jgi:hypothetical protein